MPKLAVIGHPVAHSRSPAMQNAALGALGLEDWSYRAIDAAPGAFEMTVRELAAVGYAGVNVTVPHKEAALRLADEASEAARQIGAANTLVFRKGHIEAHNTDAPGLLAAYRALPANPVGIRALVLGAGGAARAAVWAFAKAGAVVYIWNRTSARADSLHAELGSYVEIGGAPVSSPSEIDFGILVNTTTVGLKGEDLLEEIPIPKDALVERVVVDMVYGEKPTALLTRAERAGATTVDGLEILVQQGARSLEIWTGREPDLDVMREAARRR
jgi:shikimate dehydrogenase